HTEVTSDTTEVLQRNASLTFSCVGDWNTLRLVDQSQAPTGAGTTASGSATEHETITYDNPGAGCDSTYESDTQWLGSTASNPAYLEIQFGFTGYQVFGFPMGRHLGR